MPMVQKCPIRHPLKLGGSDGDHPVIRFVEGQLLTLVPGNDYKGHSWDCLLYTSDAADD